MGGLRWKFSIFLAPQLVRTSLSSSIIAQIIYPILKTKSLSQGCLELNQCCLALLSPKTSKRKGSELMV